jgi:chromosome segregation protein
LLKLKRVELQGFKSFCDRTDLRFHGEGIAAIVGPNGCGKSNLADAIHWVLGEQSAKSLRGARMEDVIFAGTRDRKAVGLALVNLTLVDPTGQSAGPVKPNGHVNGQANGPATGHANGAPILSAKAPSQSSEITITRRLFRSGDSEYLINGKVARLRDIQDIFLGTGLGPESYAIIEQGRIGQILSSKPQDRRAVIEEAAGITKFKTRRRLAEAKLEGARQNLTRVFDILEEVNRQVNSLKRQAAKTRRYEELRGELTSHLRTALSGRYQLLEREAVKIALDLNAASSQVQALQQELAQREQDHARIQSEAYALEEQLTERRKHLAELQVEAERARGRLESQSRQIAAIDQRLSQGAVETQDLDNRFKAAEEEIAAQQEMLRLLDRQAEEAQGRLLAKNEERERIQQAVQERERKAETARQGVLRLLGEASTLRNHLAEAAGYLDSLERDKARSRKEEETAAADLERLAVQQEELAKRSAAKIGELAALAEERKRVEAQLATYKSRAGEARRQLDQTRSAFSGIQARKDSLEQILTHHAYTTETVKRLFTAIDKGKAPGLQTLGVLADFIEVDPAWEKAVEEYLHEELEYVVVENWENGRRGIEFLRGQGEGRAAFLTTGWKPDDPAVETGGPGSEPGILGRLGDVLRPGEGSAAQALTALPRIARCCIVEDAAAAERLAARYPGWYFLLADGVCYHGPVVGGGRKSGSGPLGLKRELRELTTAAAQKQKEVDRNASLLSGLEQEIVAAGEDLERLRALQQAREKESVALDHETHRAQEERNRASSRLSLSQTELQRLQKETERSIARRDAAAQAVTEKEAAKSAEEEALESARRELESLSGESSRIQEEHSVLRVELAGLEERRRSGRAAAVRLEGQMKELANRHRNLADELERKTRERAWLATANTEIERRAAGLAQEIEASQRTVESLAGQESALRAALIETGDALKVLRATAQEAMESRSHIELELVKRQSDLKHLEETCRKELNASLQELSEDGRALPDENALAEAEDACQRVKAKIDALGPVNPQALQEFDEAQQRYDFLSAQRQDLIDSIRDTERAIQEIDQESRKRFTEAFHAINTHFRGMFQTLFGGGIGEMRLADETNPIDSGIEIVASPPGKRLQNVLLLSGGEKALTALALLMAVFRYQPSPFCILDEVDAPLDDANIGRLMNLLQEMSAQTQFILITHSKKTMETAQVLYGVTMQEPGISKLVSVRFHPFAAPPPQVSAQALQAPVA